MYKTENNEIIDVKFNIGDIVNITNLDHRFTTYKDAFKYFGIMDKTTTKKMIYGENWPELDFDYDTSSNFVILGIAIHGSHDNPPIVYHAANIKRQHIIITENGLKLKRRAKITEEKDIILYKIPKYIS